MELRERFTDRSRRSLSLAQEQARTLKHDAVGTGDLLLGLLEEGEGVACRALKALGISFDEARRKVEEFCGLGVTDHAVTSRIPYSERTDKVLELSLREALQLGHNYIGTEHILLGLIREGEGVAAQVLVKLGAELTTVRREVIQQLTGYVGKTPHPMVSAADPWAWASTARSDSPTLTFEGGSIRPMAPAVDLHTTVTDALGLLDRLIDPLLESVTKARVVHWKSMMRDLLSASEENTNGG